MLFICHTSISSITWKVMGGELDFLSRPGAPGGAGKCSWGEDDVDVVGLPPEITALITQGRKIYLWQSSELNDKSLSGFR